jgi:hypothetical protein
MVMNVVVLGHQAESDFLVTVQGPWKKFKDRLIDSNLLLIDPAHEKNFHVLIANCHSEKFIKLAESLSIPKSRRVLIIWEPSVVDRKIHTKKVVGNYGHVYTPSIEWAKKTNAISFKWPQESISGEDIWINWESRKKRIIVIQGNKFSACKGELYSFRRKVIGKVNSIDLYGTDWNRGFVFDMNRWLRSLRKYRLGEISFKSLYYVGKNYNNYFGSIDSKLEVLKNYKISIVVENTPDYISEKLFDSIRSGCVTVYIGPELTDYGISKEVAFQVNPNFKELSQLVEALLAKSDKDLYEIAVAQRASLMRVARQWEDFEVYDNLAKKIAADLQIVSS